MFGNSLPFQGWANLMSKSREGRKKYSVALAGLLRFLTHLNQALKRWAIV
jgi:hypothetical protein